MAVTPTSVRVDTAGRRKFTIELKKQIVADYLAAGDETGRGEVLRRWGTFQQNVSRWNQKIEAGTLGAPRKKRAKNGPDKAKIRVRLLEKRLAARDVTIADLRELVAAQGKVS